MERHIGQGTMFSDEQRDALFAWLTEHRDQPKFIITSSPFVTESVKKEEKWTDPDFEHHRHELIDFLAREKLDNVVFLAGDVHASAHSAMTIETPDGSPIVIHELVSSPVNASIMRKRDRFAGDTEGITAGGTRYNVDLDEESFIGRGFWPTIGNSNVLKIRVDGDDLQYEFHRTRKNDDVPFREGRFSI